MREISPCGKRNVKSDRVNPLIGVATVMLSPAGSFLGQVMVASARTMSPSYGLARATSASDMYFSIRRHETRPATISTIPVEVCDGPCNISRKVSGSILRAYRTSPNTAMEVNAMAGVSSSFLTSVKCCGIGQPNVTPVALTKKDTTVTSTGVIAPTQIKTTSS